MFKFFKFIDSIINKTCSFLLVTNIIVILVISLMGMLARYVNVSPLWIDPLVRHLVYILAFLSGILITGNSKHISIDLLDKYLEDRPAGQRLVKRTIYLVSALSILWLVKASYDFLLSELQFSSEPGFLDIKSSVWVSMMPIGFTLIAYRYFVKFLATFQPNENKEQAC